MNAELKNKANTHLMNLKRQKELIQELSQVGRKLKNAHHITLGELKIPTFCVELICGICDKHKVDVESVLGKSRVKELMTARKEVAYTLKDKFDYPYEKIGEIMSGRNHVAAMYLYKKHKETLK